MSNKFTKENFCGVWSAMSTPLTGNGGIDEAAVERLVEHQICLGVRGLFICGTSGEGPWLSDAKRRTLTHVVVRTVAGRIPVAVQITDNSAERMIDNMRMLEESRPDIFVIAPPFFQNGATQDFLVDLYEEVIQASSFPIGIYNRGKYSSVLIEPETLIRIARNPKVLMVKDSASTPEYCDAVMKIRRERDGELYALSGNEFNCVEYLKAGYDGVLLGGACFNGAMACEIYRLSHAGEYGKAQDLQDRMNTMMHKVFGGEKNSCWLAGQKELMRRIGIFGTAKTILGYRVTEACSDAINEVIRDEKEYLFPERKGK